MAHPRAFSTALPGGPVGATLLVEYSVAVSQEGVAEYANVARAAASHYNDRGRVAAGDRQTPASAWAILPYRIAGPAARLRWYRRAGDTPAPRGSRTGVAPRRSDMSTSQRGSGRPLLPMKRPAPTDTGGAAILLIEEYSVLGELGPAICATKAGGCRWRRGWQRRKHICSAPTSTSC